MSQSPCILILYTELAGYIRNCIEKLPAVGFEVHVVAWPVNKEAPFDFKNHSIQNVHYYSRSSFSTKELLNFAGKLNPKAILCSGWVDKAYLKVCAAMAKTTHRILALDNKWDGGIKQQISSTAGRILIHRCFSHCWVPGPEQYRYAAKLGFSDANILQGFYAADVDRFQKLYEQNKTSKEQDFPKRYLYIGRYIDFKGIEDLWEAFRRHSSSDWELWCAGTGPLFKNKPEIPGVHHLGFVQPAQMDKFVKETSVFIMPSRVEPWGVAVHEFAAAGFPLLCSNKVGAATLFLKEGLNGFSFESKDPGSILRAMRKIENLSVKSLLQMGEESSRLAGQVTPQLWVKSFLSIFKNKV